MSKVLKGIGIAVGVAFIASTVAGIYVSVKMVGAIKKGIDDAFNVVESVNKDFNGTDEQYAEAVDKAFSNFMKTKPSNEEMANFDLELKKAEMMDSHKKGMEEIDKAFNELNKNLDELGKSDNAEAFADIEKSLDDLLKEDKKVIDVDFKEVK